MQKDTNSSLLDKVMGEENMYKSTISSLMEATHFMLLNEIMKEKNIPGYLQHICFLPSRAFWLPSYIQ